jgi:cytoskeletal protein RodZ
MKIIIIIIICLFFSLTITPINEFITNPRQIQPAGQTPAQPAGQTPAQPAGQTPAQPAGQAPAQPQASSGGSLEAQVNMLSTQMQSTNAMALEAKQKADKISSQIEEIKKELEKEAD